MQLKTLFFASLVFAVCKGGDNTDLAPSLSSNTAGYEALAKGVTPALNQQSVATSALNALANIFANGGNYVIDASSLGGGVLAGRDGRVLLQSNSGTASAFKDNSIDGKNILSQLTQYVGVQVPQENSAAIPPPSVAFPTPYPELAIKPTARPYPISITRSVPMPVKTMYIRKYVSLSNSRPYAVKFPNPIPKLIHNSVLLKILVTNPDYDYFD